jgi:hypothetical protein
VFEVKTRNSVFDCPICKPLHDAYMANTTAFSAGDHREFDLLASINAHDSAHIGWYWRERDSKNATGPFATERDAMRNLTAHVTTYVDHPMIAFPGEERS